MSGPGVGEIIILSMVVSAIGVFLSKRSRGHDRNKDSDGTQASVANFSGSNEGPSLKPRQEELDAPAPRPDTVIVKEKVIERQVMVTRCKFCGQITPVDLNNCEKCGAAAFS